MNDQTPPDGSGLDLPDNISPEILAAVEIKAASLDESDYFQILEVPTDADQHQIKDAYRALAVLKEVLRRMGRSANLRLFIAGATDTVGDAASNQKLSMARAKSIGRYFRSKGVRIPIFAAGLGENGLKVATADEVDEVQNRRADYIVSVEEPVFSGGVPPVTWQKIP